MTVERAESWTIEKVERLFQFFLRQPGKSESPTPRVQDFRDRILADERLGQQGKAAVLRWYNGKISS